MYYIYLRKSRADNESETVEEILKRHEQILQDYALKTFGDYIPEDCIFREIGSGESIQNRPMVGELLNRVQIGNCQGVLVVDPQRLSRGDLQDCGMIIRIFQYSNTPIITPTKTYTLSDKLDRKYLEMELMRGNDYLEYVKEIMLRGRLASVGEGNFIGSIAPYGYDKVKIGKSYTLAENAESDVVRLMFEMYVNQNLGVGLICQKLDEMGIKPRKKAFWTVATVKDILHNPVYVGKIRWNWRKTVKKYENGQLVQSRPKSKEDEWILVDGKHPALISQELFDAAQKRFGNIPKTNKITELINPFSGLCHCECGGAMISRPCQNAQLRIMCLHQTHCHNKSAIFAEFQQGVIDELQKHIRRFEIEREKQKRNPSQTIHDNMLSNLRKQLAEVEMQQEKLYDLLERGIYSDALFIKRNNELAERRKSIKNSIAKIQNQRVTVVDYDKKIKLVSEAISCIQNPDLSPKEKNVFLRTVIESMTYSRKVGRYDKTPFKLEVFLCI